MNTEKRIAYHDTIETLLGFVGRGLSAVEAAKVEKIKEAHKWDGFDCSCGGGWRVGHQSSCPENQLDRLYPLDLSNALKPAFAAGYEAAAGVVLPERAPRYVLEQIGVGKMKDKFQIDEDEEYRVNLQSLRNQLVQPINQAARLYKNPVVEQSERDGAIIFKIREGGAS